MSRRNPIIEMGFINSSGGGAGGISLRRTDQDRRLPREIVTAQILGDPAPGRKVPVIVDSLGYYTPPPIFLTRQQMLDWHAKKEA